MAGAAGRMSLAGSFAGVAAGREVGRGSLAFEVVCGLEEAANELIKVGRAAGGGESRLTKSSASSLASCSASALAMLCSSWRDFAAAERAGSGSAASTTQL
jgi:hypothetical protein